MASKDHIANLLHTRVAPNRSLNIGWSDAAANEILVNRLIPELRINLRDPISQVTTPDMASLLAPVEINRRFYRVPERPNVAVEIRDITAWNGKQNRLVFLTKFGRLVIPEELKRRH